MPSTTHPIRVLFNSALSSICGAALWLISLAALAAPQLVTPQLPPAILGQPYAASLMVGSALPLASAAITGLPPGLAFAYDSSGNIAINGTPVGPGSFVLNVSATDTLAAALNASVVLTVFQVASNVTSVSAGNNHSCAVVNGGVQCWGDNAYGQLGNNSTTSSRVPVQAIAAGNDVTAVSAGDVHSCAVVNGGVQCWGYNFDGQLGNNDSINLYSLVPVQAIVPGSNVTAVSVSGSHSCAVVNGGVQCWGSNRNGQLGNNSASSSRVPVQAIAGGSNVTAVSSGRTAIFGRIGLFPSFNGHTCAVVNSGLQCWGYNNDGQLGNNSTTSSSVPVQTIASGSNVTAISAGQLHSCAVANGGVQCWGDNGFGQLGNNSTTRSLVPGQTIAAGSNVTAVSAGGLHGCALVNGGVQCWGSNYYGQLGNNSTTQSLVPVQAAAAGSNVTTVSTGGLHSCAVVNGRVQCWGSNGIGQLGNDSTPFSLVPVQAIAAGSNVTSISAGEFHGCAVVNGGVQCFGRNDTAQLGNNTLTESLVPVQAIAARSNVTALSAGSRHNCAVVNGGVQCWGYNVYGQLGNNSTTTYSLVPVQAIAAGNNVTAVAAGVGHSCAVVNGGVQCWGYNYYGQLGINSTKDSLVPAQAITPGSNVTAVSVSGHSCAVVNGGVQCWGNNSTGQLGINSTKDSPVPVQAIAAGSNVTAVSAGYSHSCAVVNGGVQCWGGNASGQLGNNSTKSSLVPVQAIAAGSNVTSVSAANVHSCAVVNGGVQCWGDNTNVGNFGNNSTTRSLVPVQAITAGGNVTALSAGLGHSCAVVNDGAVCWGSNGFGQLADANSSPALRPVTTLIKWTSTPISLPFALYSNNTVAGYGDALTLSATVAGNGQTGTVTFRVATSNGVNALAGCEAVKLVARLASCIVPSSYQNQNPRLFQATYSGDTYNLPTSANLSQVISSTSAVLTVAAMPLPPIAIGRTATLTALVKMNSPSGSVTFSDNGVAITGCAQVPLSLLPNATDAAVAAVATCTVAAPASASGVKQYVVTYAYPAGHPSGKVSEQTSFDLRVSAQATTDYTDMWWAGSAENGWGMSVTQHGPIQFNVIFAYDNLGKSLWYVMPNGRSNSTFVDNVFTGALYLPTSSPFSAYDKTKFVIGAQVGSATITYTSNGTATLTYIINGLSGSKSIQRQIFATETSGPNLRVNDLWWATSAEDGWGINIAQQDRVLFPIWYTYDAAGKATFFTAQGGSWNGTVWSGTIYAHTSSPWLGVAYNPGAFTATNVGSISLDFTDAMNATMTTTVNGFTQVRHIERQPY